MKKTKTLQLADFKMAADKKKQIILQTIIYILIVINLTAGKINYWLLKNKYEVKRKQFLVRSAECDDCSINSSFTKIL